MVKLAERGASGVADQSAGIADVRQVAYELRRLHELQALTEAYFDAKRQQAQGAAHLPHLHIVLRMVGQSGLINPGHRGVVLQKARYSQRVLAKLVMLGAAFEPLAKFAKRSWG